MGQLKHNKYEYDYVIKNHLYKSYCVESLKQFFLKHCPKWFKYLDIARRKRKFVFVKLFPLSGVKITYRYKPCITSRKHWYQNLNERLAKKKASQILLSSKFPKFTVWNLKINVNLRNSTFSRGWSCSSSA
jgi:hypothetical protein